MKFQLFFIILSIVLIKLINSAPIDYIENNPEAAGKTKEGEEPKQSPSEMLQNNEQDAEHLQEANEEHPDVIHYKLNNLDASVSKYREPEIGDTTKTLVTYSLMDQPEQKLFINGYRVQTVLNDGGMIGNTGINLEYQKGTTAIKIGAERPDSDTPDTPADHTVVHLTGKARVLNTPKNSVDLIAKASKIIGGPNNNKQSLRVDLAFTQNM